MPLSRLATDSSRASEVAGLACCAVLAALALWLLVRLLWALLPSDDAALGAVASRVVSSGAPAPARSIAQWHLFGNPPAQAAASGTTTSLILRGTLADPDPKAGIAVIADAGNGERSWRVGEQVAPGVRLVAVYADRIVVARDGGEETLKLARDTNLAPADVVRPTPTSVTGGVAAAPAGAGAASGSNRTTSAKAPPTWQQTVDRLRQNPAELMKRVQLVPVLDGGKLSGVRLSTGTDVALLNQIGLQPGDVVTSVNGTPIDSIERGQQIMSSLGNASSVRVTVLRGGKPTDVTVGLQ
ncbi:type II secretion system protein GspC [Dokdonella sp.]|uniref:type II secretion system protein GspC n=1 Tax=Dokdonella sp. TaxID=2291710 RepID=UPI003783CC2E